MKIWNWLSGKKTAIGAVLLIICGIPHLDQLIGQEIIDVIYYLGTAFGVGGVIHKVKKRKAME